MEDLKERLVLFARQKYGMGHTKFEDYCGLGHGTISAIKSNGPSASVIIRIATACPELNLNWLFRGTGEMILGEPQQEEKKVAPLADVHHNEQVNLTFFSELKSTIIDAMREVTREQFNQKEKAL